jgi:hypothetical protein
LDEFSQTADDLPDVSRHEIYAHQDEEDEWEQLHYRNSLWIEDGGSVGDVSASDRFYNVIQYGDVVESVALALEAYEDAVEPQGHVMVSDTGHKMSAYLDFPGVTVEPERGDTIDLGLKIRSGHTGFHGLKYDVGAEREVCSNGMMGFVSDLHFEQSHQEPLHYGLAQNAVTAIMDGVDTVEDRLAAANDRTFIDEDEALLVLLDAGLDRYFEQPVDRLRESLREEVEPDQNPTLYDTYNAATRAITHGADVSMNQREDALERAAGLLDARGTLPEPAELGRDAVERRVETYTTEDAVEPYWETEEQTLHGLLEARGSAG